MCRTIFEVWLSQQSKHIINISKDENKINIKKYLFLTCTNTKLPTFVSKVAVEILTCILAVKIFFLFIF